MLGTHGAVLHVDEDVVIQQADDLHELRVFLLMMTPSTGSPFCSFSLVLLWNMKASFCLRCVCVSAGLPKWPSPAGRSQWWMVTASVLRTQRGVHDLHHVARERADEPAKEQRAGHVLTPRPRPFGTSCGTGPSHSPVALLQMRTRLMNCAGHS